MSLEKSLGKLVNTDEGVAFLKEFFSEAGLTLGEGLDRDTKGYLENLRPYIVIHGIICSQYPELLVKLKKEKLEKQLQAKIST